MYYLRWIYGSRIIKKRARNATKKYGIKFPLITDKKRKITKSLIVINALAVKRAEIRGALWSTAGKRVEKPLMLTLCELYGVSDKNYKIKVKKQITRW